MTVNDASAAVPPHLSHLAPPYDRDLVSTGIVHIGVGGFHRAHQAVYLDRLMRAGHAMDWGICGVGLLPGDTRMRDALAGQDHTYSLTLKHPDGRRETCVIGSLRDYLYAPAHPEAVLARMSSPTTRIVSLTITEGGYNVDDATGRFRTESPGALHDATHPGQPTTAFGYVVEALRRRRDAGTPPFTVMSCDNLPGNGRVARTAVVSQAAMSDPGLAEWIEENVAFPNSMVDRITPATAPADIDELASEGIADAWPVTCEPFSQWVLEDDFPAGRPPLEKVGVQLVDDVVLYELMKLRLLNASHQGLAHWGRLLGIGDAHEAAADRDIAAWVRAYLEREALPRLRPVPGIYLGEYVDTLFERFTNAAIGDTLARLAQDASNRMPKFVLPTIADNLAAGGPVRLGAAMVAAWALGDEGVDERGETIPVDDPAGAGLIERAARQRAGEDLAFVGDESVFGDLAGDERFRSVFAQELRALRAEGARARMRALAMPR
ncbi:mannitol dehydrogenase family protein [Actinomyces howellii]|uniref:Mannitol-1-phosphate 5-dehydrogenase n=1 Tax=Actinomyces howellii TaxID=52771 RepID=A0A3S4V4F7_9ACTO|nr:mannitol dehydrogenase family protein [Actinomyces howellii]VEG27903.1 Mannitol 2-dehydrogenase [Actinomyces howellii]